MSVKAITTGDSILGRLTCSPWIVVNNDDTRWTSTDSLQIYVLVVYSSYLFYSL